MQQLVFNLLDDEWISLRSEGYDFNSVRETIKRTRAWVRELLGYKNAYVLKVVVKMPHDVGPICWVQFTTIVATLDAWGIDTVFDEEGCRGAQKES